MDRWVLSIVLLFLLGGYVIVTAPPDPVYSVSVDGPTDVPDDETAVAFQNLSEENRTLFLDAFDEERNFAEPPGVTEAYVLYEGETYLLRLSASEGPVFSLLMPPLGGLLVFTGCLVAVYRHFYRS